jgi:hypothetical protein
MAPNRDVVSSEQESNPFQCLDLIAIPMFSTEGFRSRACLVRENVDAKHSKRQPKLSLKSFAE